MCHVNKASAGSGTIRYCLVKKGAVVPPEASAQCIAFNINSYSLKILILCN